MARPRTPTAILAANGAFDHNPARAEGRSLQSSTPPLGPCPDTLPQEVREAWNEIVMNTEPGLLLAWHFLAVRSLARLLAKENSGDITCPERAQLTKLYEQFGITPRSRSYVTVTKPEEPKKGGFADV